MTNLRLVSSVFISFLLMVLPAMSQGVSPAVGCTDAGAHQEEQADLEQARRKIYELVQRRDHAGALKMIEKTLNDLGVALMPEEKGPSPEPTKTVWSLRELGGYCLSESGNTEKAHKALQWAVDAGERLFGPESDEVASALDHLGDSYMKAGRFDTARNALDRSLMIREKVYGPVHYETAKSTNRIAVLCARARDMISAEKYLRRTIEIYEALGIEKDTGLAGALFNLGNAYKVMRDNQLSLELCERAKKMFIACYGPEHLFVSDCLLNIGSLQTELNNPEKALECFEEGLRILRKHLGPDHPNVAPFLSSIGELYWKMGDFEKARDYFEQAFELIRSMYPDNHPEYLKRLCYLGMAYGRLGDIEKGKALCLEAVEKWTANAGPDHPRIIIGLHALAMMDMQSGCYEESIQRAFRVSQIVLQRSRQYFLLLSESQMQRYLYEESNSFGLAVTALQELDAAAREAWLPRIFDLELLRRGRILEALSNRKLDLLLSDDEATKRVFDEYRRAKEELARIYFQAPLEPDPHYANALKAAVEHKQKLEIELARRSRQFREETQSTTATLDAIQSHLPEGISLVEFIRYSHFLPEGMNAEYWDAAFVLPGSGRPLVMVPLGRARETDELLDSLLASVGPHGPRNPKEARRYHELSKRVQAKIWRPVAEAIGEPRTVFVVPDGPLHLVNFAAMPAQDDGYLIEKGWSFHYLVSARDVVHFSDVERPSEESRRLLAVGDVAYGNIIDKSRGGWLSSDMPAWGDLPETMGEVEAVASRFPREEVTMLLEEAATEGNFKSRAPDHDFIHLATHGFFLESKDQLSGLSELEKENPLLLSGIVLAGANRSQKRLEDAEPGVEDGILTAEEVASLNLQNVKCAVLSACQTGRGSLLHGESVMGLRLAFRLAGVSTVVFSLPRVDDEDTRLWMGHFYESRLEGSSIVEAAHQASLRRLQEIRAQGGSDAYPARWAPFLTAGDWH